MRTFTRLTSFTYFHVTWLRKRAAWILMSSDKKQGVIRMLQELLKMRWFRILCDHIFKQTWRGITWLRVSLNKYLNQVIPRQVCLQMWSLNILNHLLCSFSAALEACWWRLASCRWTSEFMQLRCRCLRSLASCLFRSDILSSGQVLQITYNYQSSLIYHCLLI